MINSRSSPRPFPARDPASGSQTRAWGRPIIEKRATRSKSPQNSEPFIRGQRTSKVTNPKLRRSVSEMAIRSTLDSTKFDEKVFHQSNVSLEFEEPRNGKPTVWRLVKETSQCNKTIHPSCGSDKDVLEQPRSVFTTFSSFPLTPDDRLDPEAQNGFGNPLLLRHHSACSNASGPKATTFFSMALLPNRYYRPFQGFVG